LVYNWQSQFRIDSGRVFISLDFLRGAIFMGEIFTTALLSSSLILVGLVLGFALLKIQGGEE
jgi:cytochrome b6-f complex subunit 7